MAKILATEIRRIFQRNEVATGVGAIMGDKSIVQEIRFARTNLRLTRGSAQSSLTAHRISQVVISYSHCSIKDRPVYLLMD